MREGDAAFEALRAAIDELAAADARDLLAEARAEARAKVRSILAEALAQALLDHAGEALGEEQRASGGSGATPAMPGSGVTPANAGGSARSSEGSVRSSGGAGAEPPEVPPTGPGGPGPGPEVPVATRRFGEVPESSPPPTSAAASPRGRRSAAGSRPPAEESSGPAPDSASDSGSAWYVYCVLDPRELELPSDVEAVGDAGDVSLVGDDELAALVSEVPLAEFAEERLHENLNDVAWLEATALAHERVLEAALAQTTVIPLRLCTIYASEESVRDMLARERPAFTDALDRLAGRTEWGVKVFADRQELEEAAARRSEEVAALREEIEALPEGEAYLKRKQLDTIAGEEADLLVDECVDAVHGRLAERASEALLNPLQRPELSGRDSPMVLNGVYLVEDAATGSFHAEVDALKATYAPDGFEIERTGPWPPYNFVKSSIEAAR